jgi:hypothetical protein
VLKDIAEEFGTSVGEATLAILLTLAMRPAARPRLRLLGRRRRLFNTSWASLKRAISAGRRHIGMQLGHGSAERLVKLGDIVRASLPVAR